MHTMIRERASIGLILILLAAWTQTNAEASVLPTTGEQEVRAPLPQAGGTTADQTIGQRSLTKEMWKSRGWVDLSSLIVERQNDLNPYAASVALTLLKSGGVNWHESEVAKQALTVLAKRAVTWSEEFSVDGFPSMVLNFAELRFSYPALYETLALHILNHSKEYASGSIAAAARAFATMGVSARPAFKILARRGSELTSWSIDHIVDTVWSYAVANDKPVNLFQNLAVRAMPMVSELSENQVEALTWAYGSLHIKQPELFQAIAGEVSTFSELYSPSELSVIAWAFGKLRLPAPELYHGIATHVRSRAKEYSAEQIYKVSWSAARTKFRSPGLMFDISREVSERISEFSPAQLADIAWSFSELNIEDKELFQEIAARVAKDHASYTPENLAKITLAFGKMKFWSHDLFKAVYAELVEKKKEFSADHLESVSFYCKSAGVQDLVRSI